MKIKIENTEMISEDKKEKISDFFFWENFPNYICIINKRKKNEKELK